MEQLTPRASLRYALPVVSRNARALLESAAPGGHSAHGRASAVPSRLQRMSMSGLGGPLWHGGFRQMRNQYWHSTMNDLQSYGLTGLGDAASDARIFSQGAGLATPIITGVIAHSAATAAAATGEAATILGMAPALAVPIIGAALVGVTTAIAYFIKNSGCGITCVETSQWANQAEPYLKQNADAYFALATPRTQSQQTAALNVFDTIWARLQQLCGQSGTGNAGVRCISDRQANACTWHATGTPPWPGSPAVGSCWNWFNAYRDPIANDTSVVPDASAASSGPGGSGSPLNVGGGGSVLDSKTLLLLLGGGLLLLGAMSD